MIGLKLFVLGTIARNFVLKHYYGIRKDMYNNNALWCSMCTKVLSTYFYVTPILYVKFGEKSMQ